MYVISGKKRSGKDTVAKIMQEQGYKTYALASPIKEALLYAFNMNGVEITRNQINGIDYDREKSLELDYNTGMSVLIDAVSYVFKDQHSSFTSKCFDKISEFVSDINFENFSIRKFMQCFGTDIMCRLVDEKIWLNKAEYFCHGKSKVVITDCRQPWEEDFFRKMNAKFIFVKGEYTGYVESTDPHITEQGLSPKEGDIFLINKDLNQLSKDVKCLLN